MKIILGLFLVTFISQSQALDLQSGWSQNFEKEVRLSCREGEEEFCLHLCQQKDECVLKEKYCRNCAGTTLFLRNIFVEMGRVYWNSQNSVPFYEFMDFLKSGRFISITSKSVYNFVDRFDSTRIRMRFQRLCSNFTDYPIVFLQARPISRIPERVKYVVCKDAQKRPVVYYMEDEARVIVDEEIFGGSDLANDLMF